jgi:hypothetical protein
MGDVNVLQTGLFSVNRANHREPDRDCLRLGSGCMAWRWFPEGAPGETNRPDGYCGLAGVRWIDATTSW